MGYAIITGLTPKPSSRTKGRTKLDELIKVAKEMQVGDAVALTNSEAQSFRTILEALGYDCITDGWVCPERGKTYAFKLEKKSE